MPLPECQNARMPECQNAKVDLASRNANAKPMKVLILGGYGTFGGRLAELLADGGLQILIAGRDLAKARAFCTAHPGMHPLQADRATISQTLATHRPNILIDASGPFQTYGANPYGVVMACLAQGTNYLDLADGADFVAGIGQFDAQAREAKVFVLSGVSSFPVLTAAVLSEMARTMTVTEATGGIAPSPHATVGPNVLRAILSYAGAPVPVIRRGQPALATGLCETRRFTIAPPGALPLHNTLFSLVDVPDLRAIPATMPTIQTLWIGAGPRPEVLHRVLITLARMRALLRLPPLTGLAPVCQFMLARLRHGEHRGGMFVEAQGETNGHAITRSWHMLAEGEDGPLIPSMAAEAVVRQCLAGAPPEPGARSGIGALTLADFNKLFARRTITSGWRSQGEAALYKQTLGSAFDTLPASLQALHLPGARATWSGRATVRRGGSPLAALVAAMFSFPKAGQDVPVTVTFHTAANGTEIWARIFAGRPLRSTQEAGKGRFRHLITERFGPFAFGLALVIRSDHLHIIPRRWSFLGLPLPLALMPAGNSYETEIAGKFRFHVEISLPLIGPVVTYEGWLEPEA